MLTKLKFSLLDLGEEFNPTIVGIQFDGTNQEELLELLKTCNGYVNNLTPLTGSETSYVSIEEVFDFIAETDWLIRVDNTFFIKSNTDFERMYIKLDE